MDSLCLPATPSNAVPLRRGRDNGVAREDGKVLQGTHARAQSARRRSAERENHRSVADGRLIRQKPVSLPIAQSAESAEHVVNTTGHIPTDTKSHRLNDKVFFVLLQLLRFRDWTVFPHDYLLLGVIYFIKCEFTATYHRQGRSQHGPLDCQEFWNFGSVRKDPYKTGKKQSKTPAN